MIHLPEIKTTDTNTYRNFAKCHQALVPCMGLGTRLMHGSKEVSGHVFPVSCHPPCKGSGFQSKTEELIV